MYPSIVTVSWGLLLGILFMYWSAWLTGASFRNPFSFNWISPVLHARLPVWVTLLVIALAAITAGAYERQRAKTADEMAQKAIAKAERDRFQSQLSELRSSNASKKDASMPEISSEDLVLLRHQLQKPIAYPSNK